MSTLTGIGVVLKSHNGTTWDVMSGTEGVTLTKGLSSVHLPDMEQVTYRTARMPGARFQDVRWDAGELILGVTVADTWVNRPSGGFRRGDQFLLLDRAFRDSLCPFHPATVEFTALGEVRTFRGRLTGLEREDAERMPDINGRAEYEVTLTPESPFYAGKPSVFDFPFSGGGEDTNYYGPENLAPDFHISPGSAVGNVTVTNPGQVEAWPKWTVDGPGQAVVGIGDHLTVLSGLSAGERIIVDTDPATGGVWDESGDRAWDRISGKYDFTPIPHAGAAPATAQMVGGGPGSHIRLEIPRLHRSAW